MDAEGGGTGTLHRVVADRYEVLESIGQGVLLAAFRARDRALNRIVVVKTLLPEHAGNPELVERLRTGLSLVLSLHHAAIARTYDVGAESGSENGAGGTGLFLAEEYVRGLDLQERIRRAAPFSLSAATDVAIALAEALEFAHARGVTHGDVRPQNVLLGPEGQVKLIGFGTAGAQALLSGPDVLLRLLPYRAPEISRERTPTRSGDLYALGIVLYEMLTGDLPFTGDSPIQIALRHAQDPVPSPRLPNPGVPRALEGMLYKALAKEPEERYASASEMLDDLRAVREALRGGTSLSWSPQDRDARNAREADDTVAAPPISGSDSTMVMPVPASGPRRAAGGRPARGVAAAASRNADDRERPRGNRWLLPLNLFLFALVLAGFAALAWMTVYFVEAPRDVVVPNLVGKTMDEARTLGHERNFRIEEVDRQYRDKEPINMVYQMRPPAGVSIREGKTVRVWVSLGPKLVEVPDVRDMSLDGARRKLEKARLRVGEQKTEYDPLAAKGNVLRQEPAPGENKPPGTKVSLVLSLGEEPPPEPVEPPDTSYYGGGADTGVAPGDTGGPDNPNPEDKVRTFRIRYPKSGTLPRDGAPHRIRIDVTDRDGTRTVYDEVREAGDRVQEDVEVRGEQVIIRLYDNDELRAEQNR